MYWFNKVTVYQFWTSSWSSSLAPMSIILVVISVEQNQHSCIFLSCVITAIIYCTKLWWKSYFLACISMCQLKQQGSYYMHCTWAKKCSSCPESQGQMCTVHIPRHYIRGEGKQLMLCLYLILFWNFCLYIPSNSAPLHKTTHYLHKVKLQSEVTKPRTQNIV